MFTIYIAPLCMVCQVDSTQLPLCRCPPCAEAKAPDVPPEKLIVGADVYQLPAEVIDTDVTSPFATVAVPEAPLPPPPLGVRRAESLPQFSRSSTTK